MAEFTGVCEICGKSSKFRCSGCHSVAYCGKEHQKQDWPVHKKLCRMYEVKSSPEHGQYVVATRDIPKVIAIVAETPLVAGPASFHGNQCIACHDQISKNFYCSQCDWPICGPKCPGLKSPTRHGIECWFLSNIKSAVSDKSITIILPLRCLLLQKRDTEKWKTLYKMALRAAGVIPTSSSLKCRKQFEENIVKPLVKAVDASLLPDCSHETVKKVFDLLDAYGLNMQVPHFGPIVAICAVTSLMEHSCVPNTRRLIDFPFSEEQSGGPDALRCRVVVRAHKKILRGDRITSVFLDCTMSTYERQTNLRKRRNVHCKCARCSDPRELGTDFGTLKCAKPCTGWVLPVNTPEVDKSDWKCETCGKINSADDIGNLMCTIQTEIDNFLPETGRLQDCGIYEFVLVTTGDFVHPKHQFCLKIKEYLLAIYGQPLTSSFGLAALMRLPHLERIADLSCDIVNTLSNPVIVTQYESLAVASMVLSLAISEIARRKKALGEWDSLQADLAREHGEKICSRAYQLLWSGMLDQSPDEKQLRKLMAELASMEIWEEMMTKTF